MSAPADGTYPLAMTAVEAQAAIADGVPLIDIREPNEWTAGHAPGAEHVPMSALQELADRLDPDQPVILICRSGGRSAYAVQVFRQAGYQAINLDGGLFAWQQAGGAVVTDDGQQGWVA